MVNFTAISHDIGPERTYQLLSRMLGQAADVIEKYGGHVVDTAGDGLLAAFGAPNALENAPLQSCLAALEFHELVASALSDLQADYGVAPHFRSGIGGGNTMVAHIDERTIKVVGDPVNKAARLQALAGPGEIIISETIQHEAEGHVNSTDRGEVAIKGFAEPIRIFRLDTARHTRSRFEATEQRGLTEMISRTQEMDHALAALSKDASGFVLVSGPPGIGKSRLAHEIATRVSKDRPVYIGQCVSGGQTTAYGPVFDILRQAGGSDWSADRATIFKALFDRYPDLHDAEAVAQVLATESQKRDQTGRALSTRAYFLRLLHGLSAHEDCLFVIEDVHWIDTGSNALFSMLAPTPVSMLFTTRPGFRAEWFDAEHLTHIALGPLTSEEIQSVSEAHLEGAISTDLAQLIAEKAEGVPLIAGEIARALVQGDRLVASDEGLKLASTEGSLLTGNLEQLVLSRVDQLPSEDKAALQVAAAIGRDFPVTLLDDVLSRPSNLPEIAKAPGLIDAVAPGQWRFSHALIRDAIYDSLLTDQRERAHLGIAKALEQSAERSENWGALANHYLRSSDTEKSVPYLIKAAGQSLAVYALYEVDARLEEAMRFLETDPSLVDEEAFGDLAVSWLRALNQIGDFGRSISVAARVLPRLEQPGYSSALSITRTLTATARAHSRDYKGGRELALKTLEEAEAQNDDWGGAWAKVALMRIYDETKWEDLATLERLAAEIAPVAEKAKDNHLAMTALYLKSSAYRTSGRRRQCVAVANEIEAFATRFNDRRAKGYAHWARALLFSSEGNPELAFVEVSAAREVAIPGGGDERVVTGIELFCRLYTQPPDELRQPVVNVAEEARALRDFNIAHAMDWTKVILELKTGHLAAGWAGLKEFILATEEGGNMNLVTQGYLTKAETLLSIAGLLDVQAEAPPERPAFPTKRPGVRDLITYFGLRIVAKKEADLALRKCMDLPGAHQARCKIGLGLLASARGEVDLARTLLNEGIEEARSEELAFIVARGEHALALLNG